MCKVECLKVQMSGTTFCNFMFRKNLLDRIVDYTLKYKIKNFQRIPWNYSPAQLAVILSWICHLENKELRRNLRKLSSIFCARLRWRTLKTSSSAIAIPPTSPPPTKRESNSIARINSKFPILMIPKFINCHWHFFRPFLLVSASVHPRLPRKRPKREKILNFLCTCQMCSKVIRSLFFVLNKFLRCRSFRTVRAATRHLRHLGYSCIYESRRNCTLHFFSIIPRYSWTLIRHQQRSHTWAICDMFFH